MRLQMRSEASRKTFVRRAGICQRPQKLLTADLSHDANASLAMQAERICYVTSLHRRPLHAKQSSRREFVEIKSAGL